MSDRKTEGAKMAVELETRCNIDINAAREESSWYALLNVLSLSLGSRMGIDLNDEMRNREIGTAGVCVDDLSAKNIDLLQAVFKNGIPLLGKRFSLWDMDTWRWNRSSFDREIAPKAQGWTIVAELECAKWLSASANRASLSVKAKTDWKTLSLVLGVEARVQCEYAFENLRDANGLFVSAVPEENGYSLRGEAELTDQLCMLMACSDLSGVHGKLGSVLMDEESRKRISGLADQLLQVIMDNEAMLLEREMNKSQALSLAVSAFIWYASASGNRELNSKAMALVRKYADILVAMHDSSEMVGNSTVDAAAALKALCDAFRTTRLRAYANAAMDVFNFLESQWWNLPGLYASSPMSDEYTYNADDIGIILSALNASRLYLKDRINRGLAELRLRVFFCNAVNLSGLQMSMPSMDFLPDWFQQREPSIHFRHNAIPLPGEVGGGFGVSPVMAAEVAYNPQGDMWSRRMMFDTSAAMRASCELMWLNHDAVNGFPDVNMESTSQSVREASGSGTE